MDLQGFVGSPWITGAVSGADIVLQGRQDRRGATGGTCPRTVNPDIGKGLCAVPQLIANRPVPGAQGRLTRTIGSKPQLPDGEGNPGGHRRQESAFVGDESVQAHDTEPRGQVLACGRIRVVERLAEPVLAGCRMDPRP